MEGPSRTFETAALPHLDAAYNYARWLTGNAADAEDVVQEAFLRALRYFRSFRGGDARAWLLTIVRNTFHSRRSLPSVPFEADRHDRPESGGGPEAALIARSEQIVVRDALDQLPADFKEALILREFEGLSYKEIADVTGVPIGTVMSRLARARERLHQQLALTANHGGHRGLH